MTGQNDSLPYFCTGPRQVMMAIMFVQYNCVSLFASGLMENMIILLEMQQPRKFMMVSAKHKLNLRFLLYGF